MVSTNVQLCKTSFKTYFFPFANGNRQVTDPVTNLKSTARECCASCLEEEKCNAWQWCPVEIGCSYGNTSSAASSAVSNTSFPYLGCQLLNLEGFSNYLFDMTNVVSRGEAVPFVAGAPLNLTVVEVDGYDSFVGNELGGRFDFECIELLDGVDIVGENITYDSSPRYGCMVSAGAEEVASICTALGDGRCVAFDYYPNGFDPWGVLGEKLGAVPLAGPVGVLKTGDVAESFLAEVDLNPNSVVYVKSGVLPAGASSESGGISDGGRGDALTGGSDGDGGVSTAVIVVVSVIVGLIVIAGLFLMFYYIKRYQQMTKSFPSPPMSMNSGGTGTPQIGRSPMAAHRKGGPFTSTYGANGMVLVNDGRNGNDLDSKSMAERNSSDELATSDGRTSDSPPRERRDGINDNVVVTEVSLPPMSEGAMQAAGRPGSAPSSAPGSSARDLMDAFSQMYMKRPTVDYAELGSLKEDEETKAVEEMVRVVAAEQSRRASRSGQTTPESSNKIPSLIKNEATGLEHAGLADDWSILPEEVEVCRRPDGTWWQLGTGGFGTVYRGLYHGIHPVAIKIIHHVEEDRHKDAFIREATLLKALRHRNVVQFLGASLDGPQGTALLVTELMELGDMWRALPAKDDRGERIFGWYNRGAQCVADVANGLHYLHTKRVVHFDLKSANILLSKAGTAKLADIGMARVLNKSHLSIISGLGTFAWSAPEVLAGRRCTEKADIYSLGVVLWEICTGEAPNRGDMRSLEAPEDCPQAIVDLYKQCVRESPEERPSALECLQVLKAFVSDD